jgi:eukaryotic-like serine/threonine-protein kinase
MTPPRACPDNSTLRDFLQDRLAGADAERIDDHIGGCPACQRALDRLVGSLPGRWLPDADGSQEDAPVTHVAPAALGVIPRVLVSAVEPGGPDGPVARPGSSGTTAADDAPARIHLFGEIARGGMGAILKGRDVALGRDLAVKILLNQHRHNSGLVRRFVMEARIAGQLQHPGTVPIHELGTLDDGRPYFAMKLVKGRTLAALLKERTDPSQNRPRLLGIFEQICQTVAYAHARSIIHRDLKPANVMVGRFGEVQVMDWGLAKVLADTDVDAAEDDGGDVAFDNAGDDGDLTNPGSVLGTWPYMAPEQARGLVTEVDRRSDVFGLGAILCEILTGGPPYIGPDSMSVRLLAIEGRTDEVSARLEGCGADSELIQLAERCLAAHPADRPTDGGEVTSAVAAYRSGVQERLQQERLARERQEVRVAEGRRRHRVLAAAALIVLLTLSLGVVASTMFALGERAARQKAAQEAIRATRSEEAALQAAVSEKAARGTAEAKEAETQAVLTFLEDRILSAARPRGYEGGLGPEVTLRSAIDAALPFVETGLKDQPLTEARLRLTLGNSYWYLGDGKAAEAQYAPARAIRARLLGPAHPDTLGCAIQIGISYAMLGRTEESVGLYRELLPACRGTFGPDSLQALACMNNLGMGLNDLGRYDEAVDIYRQALAIKQGKFGPDHRSTLTTMVNLANAYHSLRRYEDALKFRNETLELFRARYGPDDPGAMMVLHNIAANLRALGRPADALRADEEVRSRRRNVLGVDHPDTLTSLWSIAQDLIRLDRGADAVPLLDECLIRAVGKRVHRNFPEVANFRLRIFEKAKDADGCRTTAELWEKQGRTDADSLYQAAVCRAVAAKVMRQAKPLTADAARRALGEEDRAMAWLQKAVTAGFKDVADLKQDKDLEALRDRADFRKLVSDLEGARK